MKTNFNLSAADFTRGMASHGDWDASEGDIATVERGPYSIRVYYVASDNTGSPYLSMLIATPAHTVWFDNECTPGDTLNEAIEALNALMVEDFYYKGGNINHGFWDCMDPDRKPLPR
jgi:hypothetical protein